MDSIGAGDPSGRDQLLDGEITLCRRCGTDRNGLVSGTDVRRSAIHHGVHGHGFEAFLMACTDDSESDFPTIGDEDASHRAEAVFSAISAHGLQAVGGVSRNTGRRLLQRRVLKRAALS
jgi:hypothetical protein